MTKTLGNRIDALGINDYVDDGHLVEAAFVVMKVVDEDGEVGIATAWSPGTDFITRRGLLEYALASERRDFISVDRAEDDDD